MLIPYRTLKVRRNGNLQLIERGMFIELDVETVGPKFRTSDSLFAIQPKLDLEKEALDQTIDKSKTLVFDASDTKPIDGKIYLICVANKLFLRRFIDADGMKYFDTDYPQQYEKILPDSSYEVVARLIYSVNLLEDEHKSGSTINKMQVVIVLILSLIALYFIPKIITTPLKKQPTIIESVNQ
jgi:hypothetical protein